MEECTFKMFHKNQVVKAIYNGKEINVSILSLINKDTGYTRYGEYENTNYLAFDGKTLYLLNEDIFVEQDDFNNDEEITVNIVIIKELATLEELNSINFNHE